MTTNRDNMYVEIDATYENVTRGAGPNCSHQINIKLNKEEFETIYALWDQKQPLSAFCRELIMKGIK